VEPGTSAVLKGQLNGFGLCDEAKTAETTHAGGKPKKRERKGEKGVGSAVLSEPIDSDTTSVTSMTLGQNELGVRAKHSRGEETETLRGVKIETRHISRIRHRAKPRKEAVYWRLSTSGNGGS